MHDVEVFGLMIAAVAIALTAAILANHLTERFRVPAPAIFLVAAVLLADLFPGLSTMSFTTVPSGSPAGAARPPR